MGYAVVDEVEAGFRTLSAEERLRCTALLEEASVIIDAYGGNADPSVKGLVSCRMVRRLLGDGNSMGAAMAPMGATQGSASALGYVQSWTMSGGSAGEMYLSKLEKKLLGVGSKIGAASPVEVLCDDGN